MSKKKKATGKKFDEGKPDLFQIPGIALNQAAFVLMFGQRKYGKYNWMTGIEHSKLINSALRHLMADKDGHTFDKESGLPHIAHALVNIMQLVWMRKNRPDLDDRPIKKDKKRKK